MSAATQLAFGWAAAAAIALAAYRAGSLNRSGATAAFVVGGLTFGFGGWAWALLLLVFFISSSALSHLFRQRKHALSEKFSKGHQRDWGQVAANGALAAALAAVHAWHPESRWVWPAFAGALAAVNADTWATEIGVLARSAPRYILSGKPVPRGTSGGVSLLGFGAALAGAALIGVCALSGKASPRLALAVTVGGWLGAVADSILGATVQAMYFCPQCQKETEHTPQHTCGAPTVWRRGWRWMNNDAVNFIASAVGAIAAALLSM